MTSDTFEQRIAAVRRFSRFYTRELGLLRESLVATRFSLTEARVLYELAHREQVDGERARGRARPRSWLSQPHPAPLRRGRPVKKVRAPDDGRQSLIAITAKGRRRSRRSTRARTTR